MSVKIKNNLIINQNQLLNIIKNKEIYNKNIQLINIQ